MEAINKHSYADRVRGCLLAGAIGDAFGYEIEFDSLSRIRQRFGPEGLTAPVRHRGRLITSDDTQMTLFTLEGLLRARSSGCLDDLSATLEHLRLATLDWFRTQSSSPARERYTGQRSPVMQVRRAPGNTCLSACALGATGTIERPLNNSKGCGGVMRVAPIGLMRELTVDQAFELGARAAAQTHGHPDGYLAAGYMAAMIRELVDGAWIGELNESLEALQKRAHHESVDVAVIKAWNACCASAGADPRGLPEVIGSRLGEGWVGEEALAIGYFAACHGGDGTSTLPLAANHGGDSDSTASIAGQLVGAEFGLGVIPMAWREGLDCEAELLELAHQLA